MKIKDIPFIIIMFACVGFGYYIKEQEPKEVIIKEKIVEVERDMSSWECVVAHPELFYKDKLNCNKIRDDRDAIIDEKVQIIDALRMQVDSLLMGNPNATYPNYPLIEKEYEESRR